MAKLDAHARERLTDMQISNMPAAIKVVGKPGKKGGERWSNGNKIPKGNQRNGGKAKIAWERGQNKVYDTKAIPAKYRVQPRY